MKVIMTCKGCPAKCAIHATISADNDRSIIPIYCCANGSPEIAYVEVVEDD
jgi:hypothetical protein